MGIYYIKLINDNGPSGDLYVPGQDGLTLLEPELTMDAGKAGSLTFTMPPGHLFYDAVHMLSSTIVVGEDWVDDDPLLVEPDPEVEVDPEGEGESDPGGYEVDPEQMYDGFWVGRPTEIKTDFWGRRQVYCEGALAFLNDTYRTPTDFETTDRGRVFQALLANHNNQADQARRLQAGVIQPTNLTASSASVTEAMSTRDALQSLCIAPCSGYLNATVRNGYLVLDWMALNYSGNEAHQRAEYGLNLLDLEQYLDGRSIATQVYATNGKGISTLVSAGSALIAKYGTITRVLRFPDARSTGQLSAAARAWMSSQFEGITLQVDAADLHTLLPGVPPFRLGQRVRVRSDPHGVNTVMPITKISVRMDTMKKEITMGYTAENLTQSGGGAGNQSGTLAAASNVLPSEYTLIKQGGRTATVTMTRDFLILVMERASNAVIMLNYNGTGFNVLAGTVDSRITVTKSANSRTATITNGAGQGLRVMVLGGCVS